MPSCKEAQTILGLKAVSRFKRLVGRRKKQNKKKKNLNKSLGLYLCHTACLLLKHNLQMCASLANHTKASVPGNQSCSCQHFLTQCPRTRADLTDTAALKEREGTICVPEATPPRQKHHSSQGKPCWTVGSPNRTLCNSASAPLQWVLKMPLISATEGSGSLSWENQRHPNREKQILSNRIITEFVIFFFFWRKPLFLYYCYWNPFNETWVAGKFQLFPWKDRAGRLRPSYFIARVVVLVFKLPEFLQIPEEKWQV